MADVAHPSSKTSSYNDKLTDRNTTAVSQSLNFHEAASIVRSYLPVGTPYAPHHAETRYPPSTYRMGNTTEAVAISTKTQNEWKYIPIVPHNQAPPPTTKKTPKPTFIMAAVPKPNPPPPTPPVKKLPDPSKEREIVPAELDCKKCGKEFERHWDALVHKQRCNGEKPCKCKICGKTFTLNANLKTHLRIHTGEKHYKCDVCGEEFVYSYHLTNHKVSSPSSCG